MKLNRITWTAAFFISLLSFVAWFRFSYPQLEFVNFSVDRAMAMRIARDYLAQRGEDSASLRTAIVSGSDESANRYLQKTIGFDGLIRFVRENDFDLFYWIVRFFKENEKEECRVVISSASGEIISFQHTIDENEARPPLEREEAKHRAIEFLKSNFYFDLEQYTIQGDLETVLDNRSDFFFSWQRKDIHIPWDKDENAGTGKLLMGVKITGDEVLSFSKNMFRVPDQFNRYLARMQNTGNILSGIIHIFYLAIFTSAIFYMIVRRNHLAMHATKRFYIGLMIFSFALSLLSAINQLQNIIFQYGTTMSFRTYFWQFSVNTIVNALFISVSLFMPSLAGEALHYQVFKEKTSGSFLHYVRSTFFSRDMTQAVVLGYFVCIVMLGIQSLIVKVGQQQAGVWIEHAWMNNLSTAYWPFLAAFTIGFKASFTEELMYRLFAISFGRKIFKSTLAAVVISSLIWGFSHSSYPVFPMWFRGIEVTCLGLFLSFVYLRYGIIPTIVGHYLFDVFWNCSEYIFGASQPFYFYSSLSVLLLPLLWGCAAFLVNKKAVVKPMRWRLNKHQIYNLEVLKTYLNAHKEKFCHQSPYALREEISSHGWDVAVVDYALKDLGMIQEEE
ncbi:MAG: hypothetical protein A3D87_00810 [Omnitrophica WOR_2 bacterium RIFCSPHIGHO2_02_FULL_50_17]|nr:MAG: hypothetical protein A3D87_00810 [Omnitrophica WOR_2 bacterium RIFCSPHIGHO2_02_FULL_50_17]